MPQGTKFTPPSPDHPGVVIWDDATVDLTGFSVGRLLEILYAAEEYYDLAPTALPMVKMLRALIRDKWAEIYKNKTGHELTHT